MASNPCVDLVHKALDGKVTKAKILSWSNEIEKEFKKSGETFSDQDVMNRVVELGRKKIRDAYLVRRNTALLLDAQFKIQDYVLTNFKDKPIDGIISQLAGIQSWKKGTRNSAYAGQQELKHSYLNNFILDLKTNGLVEQFKSGQYDDDVMRELFDMTQKVPSGEATKNPTAKKIAELIRKAQETARVRANRAGADIGFLEGFIMTQSHETTKIFKAGMSKWVDDIMPLLDYDKTLKNAEGHTEITHYLEKIYKTLSTGRQFIVDNSEPTLSRMGKKTNIGGAISKERVLHFKSADDYIAYNRQYGSGNLRESIVSQLSNLANQTGLMEKFGPNPREALDRAINVIGDAVDNAAAKKLADGLSMADKLMAGLDGSANIPGNPTVAKWFSVARLLQSFSKLGGALISAIGGDIPVHASELSYQGQSFLGSYHSALLGKFNDIPKARRVELAQMLGTWIDSEIHDMSSSFSGREEISGKASSLSSFYYKLTGLTQWTNRGRTNISLAMSSRLGQVSSLEFSQLDTELQRVLGLFDIGDNDWKAIRLAKTIEGDKTFITPTEMDRIPDSEIRNIFGSGVDIAKTKEALQHKLRAYYIDRSEAGVLQPDLRTMTWMRQGTRPGTVEGEFMRSVTQFKGFPTALLQKTLGREIHGREQFDKSSFMGLAHLFTAMTLFGYLSMSMKDIIKGRELRDPKDWKTMQAAMLQGGAFGLYGDFLFGQYNRFGGSLLASAAGPLAGEIDNVAKVLAAIRDGDDPTAQGMKLISGNTPFVGLFYIKTAWDYAILYQMQESMNPGYLQRMEEKIEQQNKQKMFLKPSSVIPYGGNF